MTTSDTVPRRAITGEEMDVHSPYRRLSCANARPGVTAAAKRRTNRRERREGRADVDAQLRDRDPRNDSQGEA